MTMQNKQAFQFIEVVNELERVELAPLILPLLKIIDPIAKAVPAGVVKEFLTHHLRPREGQFDFIGQAAPYLPRIIRWAGRAAAVKPLMQALDVIAEALALVLRVVMPAAVMLVRAGKAVITTARTTFLKQRP